jgi:transcriptional regulator with XRE-family HTH domain
MIDHEEGAEMTINPIVKIIRAKKLGILMRDAREKSGKSVQSCADAMGLSVEELSAIESGERPATLPELEIFAYYLDVPLEHFWDSELLKTVEGNKVTNPEQIKQTRQRAIGDLIQQARSRAELSPEELALQAGITVDHLNAYEHGDMPIPLPELEALAMVLNNSIKDFEDHTGPVGSWFSEKQTVSGFLELAPELQEFISKPINRPYLELAIKLSEMKVERLRALGEGLLEITL